MKVQTTKKGRFYTSGQRVMTQTWYLGGRCAAADPVERVVDYVEIIPCANGAYSERPVYVGGIKGAAI